MIKGNQDLDIDKGFMEEWSNEEIKEEGEWISPVYNVKRISIDKIVANNYNPNSVATPEMKLLIKSIQEDGYTMPIICFYDKPNDKYIIVDGFHRYTVAKEDPLVREREGGTIPVSVIDKPMKDRIASTIRHNRARGSHNIDSMQTIVEELVESGLGDDWIQRNLGMEPDELLRFKQISGLASLFKDKEFNKAWVIE